MATSGDVQITASVHDVTSVTEALGRVVPRMDAANIAITEAAAEAMVRQAKINATGIPRTGRPGGRPFGADPGTGPGNVTGQLRDSIGIKNRVTSLHTHQVQVVASRPQARRLELGFHGADSRGRYYNQPAYPYMSTAQRFVLTTVLPTLIRDAAAAAILGGAA